MIDEDERSIFGSEGFVWADLIRHWILLLSLKVAPDRSSACACDFPLRSVFIIELTGRDVN